MELCNRFIASLEQSQYSDGGERIGACVVVSRVDCWVISTLYLHSDKIFGMHKYGFVIDDSS